MTYGQDYGQADQYPQQGPGRPRPQEQWPPQYQQPQSGSQGQQGQPWRPQSYDSGAYKRRLGQPREPYPPQGQQGSQPGYSQQPYPGQPQYPPHGPPGWQQPGYGQQQPWGPQPGYQPPQQPPRKPWVARHKVLSGLIAVGAIAIIAVAASSSNKPSTPAADSTTAASSPASPAEAPSSAAASSAPSTPAAPASPSMTGAQQQAVDAAEDYLSGGQGFSDQGLLNQLTSSYGDGFSKSDAEFAINYLNPNWDQQAVDAAQGYLGGGQGFSDQGLLQQLTSSAGNGFTEAQAEYAINSLHPDWDAQAVDAAKGYMQTGGFSRSSLIQQLTSSYGSGFTESQAEYAASQVGL
jgi:hypothetical protein